MGVTPADIINFFTYHPPTPEQSMKYTEIREKGKVATLLAHAHSEVDRASKTVTTAFVELETAITDLCPDSGEKTQALAAMQTVYRLYPDATKDWKSIVDVLRNATMWANAAIACNPVPEPVSLIPPQLEKDVNAAKPVADAAKPFVL